MFNPSTVAVMYIILSISVVLCGRLLAFIRSDKSSKGHFLQYLVMCLSLLCPIGGALFFIYHTDFSNFQTIEDVLSFENKAELIYSFLHVVCLIFLMTLMFLEITSKTQLARASK